MDLSTLRLHWLPGRYAVCRLEPAAPLPTWADPSANLLSITRTDQELSIVIDESRLPAVLPPGMQVQRGFAALRVAGTLDFNLVGVLARLTGALADAFVPVFVISTFQTDYLLVDQGRIAEARRALGAVAEIPEP